MTHADLVERGLRWLQARCTFAFAELNVLGEIPDGWGYGGSGSILVECKISRSDFLADSRKFYRRHPQRGLGNLRYYLCPPGLLQKDDLPKAWGLLYCMPKIIKVVVKATPQDANLDAERALLASIVRRCAIRWPIHEIQSMPESLKPKPQTQIARGWLLAAEGG